MVGIGLLSGFSTGEFLREELGRGCAASCFGRLIRPNTAQRLTRFHRLTGFFIPETRPEALEATGTISL